MKNTTIIWMSVIGVFVAVVLGYGFYSASQPGKYDAFAQCVTDSGATFFGAFWCPHCQDQKTMFGRSAKLLPYKECSTPDGQSQLQACTDEGITGYPTWEFADGSRIGGLAQLGDLAEKTGCELPQ